MGDGDKTPLRLQFNPKVRLEFHGATITSDAGLLAFRELDDALDLTPIASDYLQESRTDQRSMRTDPGRRRAHKNSRTRGNSGSIADTGPMPTTWWLNSEARNSKETTKHTTPHLQGSSPDQAQ